jgi:hypothetical protein
MSVLSSINESLFGKNETTTKDTINAQQKGVLNEMMNNAGTYRDMAQGQQSLYNPDWQGIQNSQVMAPLQQRMADNVRELNTNNRKFGRATAGIGRKLQESANLRMGQMRMQQGTIENQRRIQMEQESRQRALEYENMANSQLAGVAGRRTQENIIQPKGGLLSPLITLGQAALTTKNTADQFNFGGSSKPEQAMSDVGGAGLPDSFGGY